MMALRGGPAGALAMASAARTEDGGALKGLTAPVAPVELQTPSALCNPVV